MSPNALSHPKRFLEETGKTINSVLMNKGVNSASEWVERADNANASNREGTILDLLRVGGVLHLNSNFVTDESVAWTAVTEQDRGGDKP